MALSHVLMWTEDHGYRCATVDDAAQKYPRTVSACSGIFICAICHQNVTFTMGNIRARHFRHDSAALTKDCIDRSAQYECARASWEFQRDLHTLPLRLVQAAGQYRLELGLLALSEESLARYSGQSLRIEGQNLKTFSYDIAERLLPSRLTWIDIGAGPAKEYCLSLSGGTSLPSQWPRIVDGMDDFALFNAVTGKRLPPFPDIEVGQEYIIASRKKSFQWSEWDLDIRLIPPNEHRWSGWKLHRVKALRFSKAAARFFLQLSASLTRCAPPSIFPLWPAFVRTPHLIYHNARELFIFIEGNDAQIRLFPTTTQSTQGNGYARIFRFAVGTRKQMITGFDDGHLLKVGRTHMLRYDYFIRKELNQTASLPKVTVTDQHGSVLNENQIETPPLGLTIRIYVPFDGEAWLESDVFALTRMKLKGGEERELKVNWGQTLTIFQGLDRIRSIKFPRPKGRSFFGGYSKESWDDAMLCRRLRRMTGDEVSTVHILAEAIQFFRGYRATCAWLFMRKIEGRVSARALSLIQALMSE